MTDRSAPATVKGFLAQAVRTVELWLDLPEADTLVCEGLEDADVIGAGSSSHYQYKEWADQVSAKQLRDVVAAFLEGFAAASQGRRKALFVFVSPADARGAVARNAGSEELLRVWGTLDGALLASRVRALFEEQKPTNDGDKRICATALKASAYLDGCPGEWVAFRDSVRWGFGSESFEEVELLLVERLRKDSRVGHLADAALGRLVHEVLRASSRTKSVQSRQLTAADREAVLDNVHEATRVMWTEGFLDELARDAYEKELALARRRIAGLLEEHPVQLPREALVKHLAGHLHGATRVVVCGLRGVGKSSLVARTIADKRVCWLDSNDLGNSDRQMDAIFPADVRSRLDEDGGVLVVDGVEMASHDQLAQVKQLASQMGRTRIIVTVRALTRALDQEVELALPQAVIVDVPILEEPELATLCGLVGASEPNSSVRPLVRSLYFFWLSHNLQAAGATTERGLLEHLWSGRALDGTESGLLEKLAGDLIARRARRAVLDGKSRDIGRSLMSKGFLIEDPRNPVLVGFAHDVMLDYAIAHHVLQVKAAANDLVAWLHGIDPVQRSWCLPSIAFEAERQLEQEPDTYWKTACELAERPVIVDWLGPATRSGASLGPLERLLIDGVPNAFTVMQVLLPLGTA